MKARLALAGGLAMEIRAEDDISDRVMTGLAEVMGLSPSNGPAESGIVLSFRRRRLVASPTVRGLPVPFRCSSRPVREDAETQYDGLWALLGVIGWHVVRRGGLALHSALCEKVERGLALAGASGRGKSTASRRLPPPWVSRSDDVTLVLPDGEGAFWAHPYPTPSAFRNGGRGGRWEVERPLRLAACFFLNHSSGEEAVPLGPAETVGRLVSVSTHGAIPMEHHQTAEVVRPLRLRRFENACALAGAVPGFDLFLSRDGPFWTELERALESP